MKKILRVINSLDMGGAERSIYENVPIHNENGLDMDLLLLRDSDNYYQKEIYKSKVNIINLKVKNLYSPRIIFKLIPIIRNYDIVHVHLFPALYWVAIAKLLSKKKVKLIFTEHATSNNRRKYILFRLTDFFIYRMYDKIIAISNAAKHNLIAHAKLKPSSCCVIENGVNLDRVRSEAKMELSDFFYLNNSEKKYILQIASFREAKDQDTLIRALKELPAHFNLIFIGDGPRLIFCEKLVRELELNDRVVFLGRQQYIGFFIDKCFALIVSSHWEGFGRAAVEGMALSKPVLGSEVEGLSDVINNNLYIFRKGDYIDLANKILLLEISDNYKNACFYSKNRAENFSINFMINKYEKLYKRYF